jgi:hypothetical protein
VKVSRFDTTTRRWKTTHEAETRRITGQAEVLWRRGIARVSLAHLGVTAPAASMFHAAAAAADGAYVFPELARFDDERFGHLTKVTGAVAYRPEDQEGAHIRWDVRRPPRLNSSTAGMPWWPSFAARLGALPLSSSLVLIEHCATCGALAITEGQGARCCSASAVRSEG